MNPALLVKVLKARRNERKRENSLLTRDRLMHGLFSLDKELKRLGVNEKVQVMAVGGFVVSRYVSLRATQDIDSATSLSEDVKFLIPIVGKSMGLGTDWLNDEITFMSKKRPNLLGIMSRLSDPRQKNEVTFSGEVISLIEAPLDAQTLLKLSALDSRGADRDILDFRSLARVWNPTERQFKRRAKYYRTDFSWERYNAELR